jgi:hypothetical protein
MPGFRRGMRAARICLLHARPALHMACVLLWPGLAWLLVHSVHKYEAVCCSCVMQLCAAAVYCTGLCSCTMWPPVYEHNCVL